MVQPNQILNNRTLTTAYGRIVLGVSGLTDAFEGSDRVVTRGMFITGTVTAAFVYVIMTVTPCEAWGTLCASCRHATHGVTVTAVAVTETFRAPCPAWARCGITRKEG